MKTTNLRLLGVCVSLFTIVSCQRDLKDLPASQNNITDVSVQQNTGRNENGSVNNNTANTGPYTVTLVSYNVYAGPNKYAWTWSVQNLHPGNGSNGTAQGLSHWGFSPAIGGCFANGNLVSAAYSTNGTSWTNLSASIHTDPSQSCSTGPVLKFDFGTEGSAPTYYRLIVNRPYMPGPATGYYKSGRNTGCGTFEFTGITCDPGPYTIFGGPPPPPPPPPPHGS